MSKYVFFTGGVVSGLGKGITAASLGRLIKARGYTVDVCKFNPYFNVDSSFLSPSRHGEIYITEDGHACDLVIGHYERILGDNLGKRNDITSGEVYSLVISKERQSAYDGVTVQVVPHITDEIKKCVLNVGECGADVVIVEVGGTVGDIEAEPYLEAIRQLRSDLGKNNVAYVHVSLVPYIDVSGEQKTKPTQHSVKELLNLGIQPDVIVCRSDYPLDASSRNKLSLFCNVDKDCIIENLVTDNIYAMPLRLEEEGFCRVVLRRLKMDARSPALEGWKALCEKMDKVYKSAETLKIGIVGRLADKYDAHVSLREALALSGVYEDVKVKLIEICGVKALDFKELDGIVVVPGLEEACMETKIAAAEYARDNNVPVLMLGDSCLLGLGKAGIEKFRAELATGASIKKQGLFRTEFKRGSILYGVYGEQGFERHFNRVVISPDLVKANGGFAVAGVSEGGTVDAYEFVGHKFYAGVAFLPEFSAKAERPNALISSFVRAAK